MSKRQAPYLTLRLGRRVVGKGSGIAKQDGGRLTLKKKTESRREKVKLRNLNVIETRIDYHTLSVKLIPPKKDVRIFRLQSGFLTYNKGNAADVIGLGQITKDRRLLPRRMLDAILRLTDPRSVFPLLYSFKSSFHLCLSAPNAHYE